MYSGRSAWPIVRSTSTSAQCFCGDHLSCKSLGSSIGSFFELNDHPSTRRAYSRMGFGMRRFDVESSLPVGSSAEGALRPFARRKRRCTGRRFAGNAQLAVPTEHADFGLARRRNCKAAWRRQHTTQSEVRTAMNRAASNSGRLASSEKLD